MRIISILFLLVLVIPAAAISRADAPAHVARLDIAAPADGAVARPLARFGHVSDIHLVDDDAWTLRVEYLDAISSPAPQVPFGAAWRPQEEFTDEVWATQVRALNAQGGLDFVVATGDSSDNAMENEITRVLDVARGTITTQGPVSHAAYQADAQGNDPWKVINAGLESTAAPAAFDAAKSPTMLVAAGVPDALRGPGANPGLDAPFYMTLGNHDHMAQGNAPGLPFRSASQAMGRLFVSEPEYVATLFGGASYCDGAHFVGAAGAGAGLSYAGDRLCDADPKNDGYYSWHQGPLRFIVLDTANDEILAANRHGTDPDPFARLDGGTGLGGRDQGALDINQFAWLQAQLDEARAAGDTVILFSHHDPGQWFYPAGSENVGFITGADVVKLVSSYDNVAAWFAGHSHDERAHVVDGQHPYWLVQTGSLIDLPQEGRVVDVAYLGDGVLSLTLTMVASDCALDAGHAALQAACESSHALSWTDPQRDESHVGSDADRDAILYVKVGPTAQAALDGA